MKKYYCITLLAFIVVILLQGSLLSRLEIIGPEKARI